MKQTLLSALTLSLLASLTFPAAAAASAGSDASKAADTTKTAPQAESTLASGILTENMDKSVRPQDDFYRYVHGTWLKNTTIPSDRPTWGAFYRMRDDVLPRVRAIIEAAAQDSGQAAGSDGQKIGDLYASFMDEQKLDALGVTPLAAEMARIDALKGKEEIPALIAHLSKRGVNTPYGYFVRADNKDSSKYVVNVVQAGLGMPTRDYYLKMDDPAMAAARAKYQTHVEKMLALAGQPDAAAKAARILALETALARVQWTEVENRDPVRAYNKTSLAALDALTPGHQWQPFLAGVGIAGKADYLIVAQPSYLTGFAKALRETALEDWKNYFSWKLLDGYAEYLSKPLAEQDFAFKGGVLGGAKENLPRWKRAVGVAEWAMGESIGKAYVEKHFPQQAKARMEVLIGNLLAAFKSSVDTLDWMGPETRKEAKAKLAKFTAKVGYPDKWRDYSALKVERGDLVGNVMRAKLHEDQYMIGKLGQPIRRHEWEMTPQTVNAYYNPEMNEIVFPAAILQPPFFDMAVDDAANYGGIGAVIGHEISHGFDDSGAQYDGDGNLRDWWSKADRAKFAAKGRALSKQYSQYSPVAGHKLNGDLTLGENIADNSGVAIAYKAYRISLGGKPAPVIDGLTGDQRFFISFAQIWQVKQRDEEAIRRVKSDEHSPGEFRTNGSLRNHSPFHQTFKVKPGDKMWLAPGKRVTVW